MRLVGLLIPNILKMVMKKMNGDSKSYCHFYYLLLKDHVFLSPQTVGFSVVYIRFLERAHATEWHIIKRQHSRS